VGYEIETPAIATTIIAGNASSGSGFLPLYLSRALGLAKDTLVAEGDLMARFFPRSFARDPATTLSSLASQLYRPIYDQARGAIVGISDFQELRRVLDLLDEAGGGRGRGRRRRRATQRRRVSNHEEDRTDAGADVDRDDDEDEDEEDMIVSESMAVLLERIAGDARERMTYLGQTLIRDEVLRYLPRIPEDVERSVPRSQSDHDHDQHQHQHLHQEEVLTTTTTSSSSSSSSSSLATKTSTQTNIYPPLQATLDLFAAIQGRLPGSVKAGLARDGIAAVVQTLGRLESAIEAQHGPLAAQLVVIRHLLALEAGVDQLDQSDSDDEYEDEVGEAEVGPIGGDQNRNRLTRSKSHLRDRELSMTLDFTSMRARLQRLFAGGAAAPSGAGPGSIWALLSRGEGLLQVRETSIDPHQDLSTRLSLACEAVIMDVTRTILGDVLTFLTRVTVALVEAEEAVEGGTSAPLNLREMEWAAPGAVNVMVQGLNAALRTTLPVLVQEVKSGLKGYGAGVAILLRPIRGNIVEAQAQLASVLGGSYPEEEVVAMGLMGGEELRGILRQLE
jgi:hypothetical protein